MTPVQAPEAGSETPSKPLNWVTAGPAFMPAKRTLFPGAVLNAFDWTQPNKGKAVMFDNPFLEKLTLVHPAVPLAIFGSAVSYFLWAGWREGLPGARMGGLFAGGLFFWTFFEYWMHRSTFHFTPQTPWQALVAYLIHGVHHAFPEDDRRLVMPPVVSISLTIPVYILFKAILGPAYGPALAGFLVGYLCYDMTHYAVHALPMRSRVANFVRKHHMLHHYSTPDRRFGVSTPLWDLVFQTYR